MEVTPGTRGIGDAVTPPGVGSTSADRVLQPLPAAQGRRRGHTSRRPGSGYLTALAHSTRTKTQRQTTGVNSTALGRASPRTQEGKV